MNTNRLNPQPPTIPGYHFEELIGRGGMGVVWKAHQLGTNRLVAIKMILTLEMPRVEQLVRFQVEAELISQVQDTHVVQTFHTGEVNGLPFLVMEFVGGGTLADRLRSRTYTPREAAELLRTIARAMGQVHRKGIVHRDLKPANVLMTEDDTPKVGDFGLARAMARETSDQSQSRIMGTVEYMSPEQARGGSRLREIAAPADVFALGVILFELLTGQLPFHSDSQLETLNQIADAKPRQPRALRKGIPRDLETICLKCLSKDPQARYADGAELADDLDRYLGGHSIRARHVGRVERGWLWAWRNPLATALIALGVGGLMLTYQYRAENNRRIKAEILNQLAEANEKTLKAQAGEATARADERQRIIEENAYFESIASAYREYQAGNLKQAEKALERCRPAQGRPDHRDWEWHHLRRRLNSEIARIKVAPDQQGLGSVALPSLAFAPGGARLILRPGVSIPLPEASESGPQRFTLKPELSREKSGVLSLNGTLVANFDYTNVIVVRNLALKGTRGQRLAGHTKSVLAVAFSPDNHRLGSVGADGSIRVWDLETTSQTLLRLPTGQGDLQRAMIAFTGDSASIAVLAWRWEESKPPGVSIRELTLWDLAENHPRHPPLLVERVNGSAPSENDSWHRLAFSPDSSLVAFAAHDQSIRLVDPRSNKEVRSLTGHTQEITCLAFFPDGRHLATGSRDHTVRIWDLGAEGSAAIVLPAHDDAVHSLAIDTEGRRLASFDGYEVKLWDLQRLQGLTVFRDKPKLIRSVALSHDGELLLRGGISVSGQLTLRNVRNGSLVVAQPPKPAPGIAPFYSSVFDLAISPDGSRIAVSTSGEHDIATSELHVWDSQLKARIARFPMPGLVPGAFNAVRKLRFTPDGRSIVIYCDGEGSHGQLWICDLATGKPTQQAPLVVPQDPEILFSPAGSELIVQGHIPKAGRQSWFFQLKEMDKPPRQRVNAEVIGFSPDGSLGLMKHFEPGGYLLRLLRMSDGGVVASIPEPLVNLSSISKRNSRLATMSHHSLGNLSNGVADRLLLWDVASGREVLDFSHDLSPSNFKVGLWFSPDGHRLIVAGSFGELFHLDGTPLPDIWPEPATISLEDKR